MKPIVMNQEPAVRTGEPSTSLATTDARSASVAAASAAAAPMSAGEIIHFAIAQKMPAAELKELVVLHERMEDRSARKMFFEALRAFQHECPPIKKNKTARIATGNGPGYSYTYAELDEIERHIKPYLEKHELAYSFDSTVDEKGALLTNVCTLRHVAGHAEKSSFTLPTSSKSAMTDQQRFSAANNFAKRQTLANVLGISITDKEVPDDEIDPTTITDDQATEVEDMLKESGADRAKFLEYFDAEKVADIRSANYKPAIAMLREKIASKARKAKKEAQS